MVCTGQQTGLFLGPLYTIYKAASTIRLAGSLAETWRTPVVPVFWLQTEDHDAAEISVCHVDRVQAEPMTLAIAVEDSAVSVAHRVLPDAIATELAKLGDAVGRLPHADEHLRCLAAHYRPGARWSDAFAGVLATLFADEGLVLLDPRDPALAPLAAPVHRRALTQARPIARALAERSAALAAAGRPAPVHVREDAPLFFLHADGPEGPRRRLEAGDGGFVEVGTRRSRTIDELSDMLEACPSAFSTSALLRPILQDTWLPTAAYVGGPGELAYFEQLPPLYDLFDVPMPVVLPRLHARLIDNAARRALTRLRLTPAQACAPFETALVAANASPSGESGGERAQRALVAGLARLLDDVAPFAHEAGERGAKSLEKTRRSMERAAGKLGRGIDRAHALRNREAVEDLLRVQARLQPRGVPQERFFGLSSFAARHGQRAVIERVLDAADPFTHGVKDLDL